MSAAETARVGLRRHAAFRSYHFNAPSSLRRQGSRLPVSETKTRITQITSVKLWKSQKKAAAKKWQEARRAELSELVKFKDYSVKATKSGSEEADGTKATFWRLQMNEDWTVPAVELARGEPKKTAFSSPTADESGRPPMPRSCSTGAIECWPSTCFASANAAVPGSFTP